MLAEAILYLALNVYHEARGEPVEGQIAVAQVTMNRVESCAFPNTVKEVVLQDWQFSWTEDQLADFPTDNKSWEEAYDVASRVIGGVAYITEVGNADHYFNPYKVLPSWANKMKYKAKIGDHAFYKANHVCS